MVEAVRATKAPTFQRFFHETSRIFQERAGRALKYLKASLLQAHLNFMKTVRGQDDTAMMAEVVGRRFRRLLREDRALPDLVVVDGGKGQVSAARGVLEQLDLEQQPLIGLAKRLDEVFLPGQPEPAMISKSSPALRLLQRIRDEAHRFAIEYHRRLRGRRVRESGLEAIPGIGSRRAGLLLRRFGSLQRLRKASREDLQEVPGLGPELAERIVTSLSNHG